MKLNLLPPESKKRLSSHKINKIALSLITLVFLVMSGLSVLLFINQATLNSNLQNLNKKIAEQEDKNNKFKSIESEMKEVFKIADSLKDLEGKRTLWSLILGDLKIDTPPTLKINSFESKEGGKTVITGQANTLKTIMLFKEKLEQSKYFKQVELGEATSSDGNGLVIFTLNLQIESLR